MANSKFYIVPNRRTVTAGIKESGSNFLCPTNTVMTGRYHKGDENKNTQYEYATLKAVDENGNPVAGTITVENVTWAASIKESSGNGYFAPANRVIVGRKHSGDENGQTSYATAIIKIDGRATILEEGTTSTSIKESSGIWFKTDANRVMTGRHHSGDENGRTYYTSAKVVIPNTSTNPAPGGTTIVPHTRSQSAGMKESGSSFICPAGTVMTGRSHTGDENGTTQYEYSTLKAVNSSGQIVIGNITIEDARWDTAFTESSGMGYDAPVNRVIVGRKHSGDENGSTQYCTAIVKFNGHATTVKDYAVSETRKESGGWNWFRTSSNQVLTGRHHFGDENGNTYYGMGTISCDNIPKPQEKFKVIVSLHSDERYFPMNPTDFITLSRFRKHHGGGQSDDGFNKNTYTFVNGNSHGPEYYNIPVYIINSHYLTGSNSLRNLRPHDKNSIGYNEVFLEPDDNLNGNLNPNGVVPVFTYSTYYTDENTGKTGERREFWTFHGYNYAKKVISFCHQGDWERVILDIVDNNIKGAWLSCHKDLNYYSADELEITKSGDTQTLKVYCAEGSHAFYNKVGKFGLFDIWGVELDHDHTSATGYQWNITENILPLQSQAWKNYAGAWGEVGTGLPIWDDNTTGPLGPWYKRWDFGL